MDLLVPRSVLLALSEPHAPTTERGHRPYPLEAMWRAQLMQNGYTLSGPAADETTILSVCHQLDANEPTLFGTPLRARFILKRE